VFRIGTERLVKFEATFPASPKPTSIAALYKGEAPAKSGESKK